MELFLKAIKKKKACLSSKGIIYTEYTDVFIIGTTPPLHSIDSVESSELAQIKGYYRSLNAVPDQHRGSSDLVEKLKVCPGI